MLADNPGNAAFIGHRSQSFACCGALTGPDLSTGLSHHRAKDEGPADDKAGVLFSPSLQNAVYQSFLRVKFLGDARNGVSNRGIAWPSNSASPEFGWAWVGHSSEILLSRPDEPRNDRDYCESRKLPETPGLAWGEESSFSQRWERVPASHGTEVLKMRP